MMLLPTVKKHPVIYFLAALMVFGLALRLLCFTLDPVPKRDSAVYVAYAEYMMEHGIGKPDPEFLQTCPQAVWLPPLYIMLIALLSSITTVSPVLCGFIISAVATTAVAAVVFFTAKAISPEKMPHFPYVAALLAEFHPALVRMGCCVLRDGLSLLLIALLIYFLIRLLRADRWCDGVFFGIILALAVLCRFETMEFFPLLLICYIFACIRKGKSRKRSLLLSGVVFAAAMMTFVLFSSIRQKTLSFPFFLQEILQNHLKYDSVFFKLPGACR